MPPTELDLIRSTADPTARARAASDYVARAEARATEARTVRDEALRALAGAVGPTAAARATGCTLAMVKLAAR